MPGDRERARLYFFAKNFNKGLSIASPIKAIMPSRYTGGLRWCGPWCTSKSENDNEDRHAGDVRQSGVTGPATARSVPHGAPAAAVNPLIVLDDKVVFVFKSLRCTPPAALLCYRFLSALAPGSSILIAMSYALVKGSRCTSLALSVIA